jgi:hypothetical protein
MELERRHPERHPERSSGGFWAGTQSKDAEAVASRPHSFGFAQDRLFDYTAKNRLFRSGCFAIFGTAAAAPRRPAKTTKLSPPCGQQLRSNSAS